MPPCYDDSPPKKLRVKDLAFLAQQRLLQLRADGHDDLLPIQNSSRNLASHPWGAAWMRQLAHCEQEGMQLSSGRSLLRHGCVLDVKLSPSRIRGLISGEELYELDLHVQPLDDERIDTLRQLCHGRLDSLVSLLEGKIDAPLMDALCHPEDGILPLSTDWRFSCTCPDWASPCSHAAALVYAAGCLIDSDPSLLFTLREIDPEQLVDIPTASADFDTAALSQTFGIDLDLD